MISRVTVLLTILCFVTMRLRWPIDREAYTFDGRCIIHLHFFSYKKVFFKKKVVTEIN